MSSPKALHLEKLEKEELQQIINRHSTSQQIAQRAKIVVLASQGYSQAMIARELDIAIASEVRTQQEQERSL